MRNSDLLEKRANLTEQQRALLQQRLRGKQSQGAEQSRLKRRSDDAVIPLTFTQRQMWFSEQLTPGGSQYNLPNAIRLSGALNVPALKQSLAELIDRHEILRTRVLVQDGEPIQVIDEPAPLNVPVIDLQDVEESRREAKALELAQQESVLAFDVAKDRLIRAKLVRISEQEHLFLITMHHLISDGWSMTVFLQEMKVLYEAFAAGRPAPLPALSVQFADYACAMREKWRGDAFDKQLAYWRTKLQGAPKLLQLPTDRPRPARPTQNGAELSFQLPKQMLDRLHLFNREESVTLFMTLMAAWKSLLCRYSGQEDILVGSVVNDRKFDPALENMMGTFINLLVFRSDLSGNPTFRELLAQVKQTALGAMAHQDLPFDKLVDALQIERSLSHTPLFQTMLVLQNVPTAKLEMSGVTLQQVDLSSTRTTYDLSLDLNEQEGVLFGKLHYNTDLFDRDRMERLLRYWERLLAEVVDNPDVHILDIELLSATERKLVLEDWNDTTAEFPQHLCVHHLFEEQVRRSPERVAVVFQDREWTYREVDRRANQLAHNLRGLGVGPEVPVGVAIERSLELIVGLFGILKAGGVYVPLDTEAPQERLRQVLREAGAELCLTQEHLTDRLPAEAAVYLKLDSQWDEIAAYPSDAPTDVDVTSDNLVALYFTSGSTGKPKGVAIPHSGWVARMLWMQQTFQLTEQETVLQKTTLTFDDAAVEIFWTLHTGARLAILEPGLHRDPWSLLDAAVRYEVAVLIFVPSMLRHFLEAVTPETRAALHRLRVVSSGGEALRPELVRLFLQRLEGVQLVNQWGPTEVSVDSTLHICSPDDAKEGAVVPIGKPISNRSVYILDDRLQPVPIGVIGELYIGGHGHARGYWKDALRTAEAFLPNPFVEGGVLYKTGDRGSWRADGSILFQGRLEGYVKLRGLRIELGEVESVLTDQPLVREAVATTHEFAPGDIRLVAYVAAQESVSERDLREAVKRVLPAYMVPSVFVLIDAVPLNPNGKVDRKALPEPVLHAEEPEEYELQRHPMEEKVAEIVAEVLGVERVGLHQNFFDLGGHSLMAAQVVARIRQNFRVEFPLVALFEAPTVAEMTAWLLEHDGSGAVTPSPAALPRRTTDAALPLSFAQQRLWFLEQWVPGNVAYHIPTMVRIKGDVDPELIQKSFEALVHRHEALRTTFSTLQGEPVQVIHENFAFSLNVVDLRDRQEDVKRISEAEVHRPFDLEKGPLLRGLLIQLPANEHVLVLVMHHIVSDAWSMGVLVRELIETYAAQREGKPSPLQELRVQYPDFALWQRDWLQGDVLEKQLDYWRGQLQGSLPVLLLPTDKPHPAVQTYRGQVHHFRVSKSLTERLNRWSREESVTLFMTLFSVYQSLLYRYTGQNDFLVGTPIANRQHSELEHLVGFFVNTLALRCDLSGEPTFRELAARVKQAALQAYAHQDVPFEKLIEVLQPERNLSYSPLFQTMFVLQNAPMTEMNLHGLRFEEVLVDSTTAKFDVTMFLTERSDGLHGVLEYNCDLFESQTIERMGAHFLCLLESLLADPDQRITTAAMLTEVESQQLLVTWNQTQAEFPKESGGYELFEQQAARTPDAPAVSQEGVSWTYSELNRMADTVAAHLQARGVTTETPVGLFMERTPEMVAGLLGIWKAGGFYIPIDVGTPPDRLRFLLEDAEVQVLVTQERLLEKLPAQAEQMDALLMETCTASEKATVPAASTVHPGQLAYMIYTSGSTGTPKGVRIPSSGLVNYLTWAARAYGLQTGDIVPVHSPLAFDLTVTSLLVPLLVGGQVWLLPDGREIEALVHTLRMETSTRFGLLKITPAHLQLLNQQLSPQEMARCVRTLVIGGEALLPEQVAPWITHAPETKIINEYGPTETVVGCIVQEIETLEGLQQGASLPIGRPIANTQIYLLDRHLQLVPIGVPGELFIGGEGLAREYWKREELTAERFVQTPYGRLYRTGDLARYRADGVLDYLGRTDSQVKIRGFRIELGEIEAALSAHPSIRECVVLCREDVPGDKRLAAYLVAADSTAFDLDDLVTGLRAQLPAYMLPSSFTILEEMPLTANGKIDRRALPVPVNLRAVTKTEYVAPRTPLEEKLCGIWAEVLHLDAVGVLDSFFDLGGHSLLATQVMSRVQVAFGVQVPLRSLFEATTVAEFALVVEAEQNKRINQPAETTISRASREGYRRKPVGHGSSANQKGEDRR